MNVGFRIVWKDFRHLVFGNPKAGKECLVEFGCSPSGPDPDTLTGDIQLDRLEIEWGKAIGLVGFFPSDNAETEVKGR